MNLSVTNEVKRLLAFPFKDGEARKNLLYGILITFGNLIVPLLPSLLLYGYIARVVRNTAQSGSFEMPQWDDWGGLLKEGFRLFGATLIYQLPLLLLFVISYLFIFVPMMFMIPMAGSEAEPVLVLFLLLGELLFFISIAVIIFLSSIYAILLPPMLAHVSVKQEFKAAFRIGEWWKVLRANLSGFLAALIVVLGVVYVLYIGFYALYMTIILCFLAPFVGMVIGFYTMVVSAAAIGDAYRAGVQKLADAPANA